MSAYEDYPEVLQDARSRFKVTEGVQTARLGEEWVEDAPGPTVRAVAAYVDDEAAEDRVRAVADDLGLVEHEPGRDDAQGKIAFVRDE